MGAHDLTTTIDGKKTQAEVRKAFSALHSQAEAYSGHQDGYSGDWNTFTGVSFPAKATFASRDEAYEYVLGDDHDTKWGDALAVRFKDKDGEKWLLGGRAAE